MQRRFEMWQQQSIIKAFLKQLIKRSKNVVCKYRLQDFSEMIYLPSASYFLQVAVKYSAVQFSFCAMIKIFPKHQQHAKYNFFHWFAAFM